MCLSYIKTLFNYPIIYYRINHFEVILITILKCFNIIFYLIFIIFYLLWLKKNSNLLIVWYIFLCIFIIILIIMIIFICKPIINIDDDYLYYNYINDDDYINEDDYF